MTEPVARLPLFSVPTHSIVLIGNVASLTVICDRQIACPADCRGGILRIGDVSVALSCTHAQNLAERIREAIDATVLGTLPLPVKPTIQ
ncbi:hypothetical protein FHS52_001203 [Erythromicrobium ramosum]|jgi:hypothetical protein|uniref:Uncharacterized protein n=1 Tax=Erythrobacter ramosus TaxID=35811 RepID=A0A6I4UIG1_9SPHN|nr:hypothetical protein [Erythrobacter ramosus]MBB3775260.1 hypothetical protein [Erythrobacter ramosus]MXP37119.1 hypothetical protein [Erythrobacter ramosus]